MRAAVLLIITALLQALLCTPALAAEWVVAQDVLIEVCDGEQKPPVEYMTASGRTMTTLPARPCRKVARTSARTYHLVEGRMVDSQQMVGIGAQCKGRSVVVDHITYFMVAKTLWAQCARVAP